MSSDSEEEDHEFALYGTLLDPLEEDTVQAKKPISVQDQIATDKHGKRRFHGAFTGGFSAGFCNTVGSLEGWTPSTFKSSRSSRDSSSLTCKPEDFMDDEDMSAFGIAPKSIQVSSSFEGKGGVGQHRQWSRTGTIPGVPVLQSLLQPVTDTIGSKLLSRMGWKPGQGIGPRLSHKDKLLASNQDKTRRKIYGCSLPDQDEGKGGGGAGEDLDEEEEVEEDESGFTYAPDEYLPYLVKPKDNEFGLGYKGLDRKPVLSNEKRGGGGFSLFDESDISGGGEGDTDQGVTFIGRNNKKMKIHGQAFGVGAFEEEDDDIYATDDMTRYDFSLAPTGSRTSTKSNKKPDPTPAAKDGEVVGFRKSETECLFVKVFPPPQLPPNYTPKCPFVSELQSTHPIQPNLLQYQITSLQSQFSSFQNPSISQSIPLANQNQSISIDQSDHPIKQARNAFERAAILDEPLPIVRPQTSTSCEKREIRVGGFGSNSNTNLDTNSNSTNATKDPHSSNKDSNNSRTQDPNFSSQGEQIATLSEQQTPTDTPTHVAGKGQPLFRPFASEPEKQTRYETYLNFVKMGLKDKLSTIQPKSMTEWERQREVNEFDSAQKLYTPLSGAMADRFTHGSQPDDINPLVKTERFAKDAADETLRQAAKNKMFGKLTREYSVWVPSDLLCKRFNIKPPAVIEARKKQRQNRNYSLFEFLNEDKSGIMQDSNSGIAQGGMGQNQGSVDNSESETLMSSIPDQSTGNTTSNSSQSGTSEWKNQGNNNRVSQNDHHKNFSRLPNPLRDEETVARMNEQSLESDKPIGKRLEDIPLTAENKVDLFKAIFLSSDEEDDDEKKEEEKDKKIEDKRTGIELDNPNEPTKTNKTVDLNNEKTGEKIDLTNEIKTNQKTGKVNFKDSRIEELKENPMKMMEMTSNEGNSEIDNVDDLYGPKLPGRFSNQVENTVGSSGEAINSNNTQANANNACLEALETDRMSVSKKRNTEVIGVRFEKPLKLGKDKNQTSRVFQGRKEEDGIAEVGEKVANDDNIGSEEVNNDQKDDDIGDPRTDILVKVKDEPIEDQDDEDMWVDADELNTNENNKDKRKPSDKSSKHKKTDRTEKTEKKRSKKTKRKRKYSNSSSSSEFEEKRRKSKRKDDNFSDEEEAKSRKSKRKHGSSDQEEKRRKSKRKDDDSFSEEEVTAKGRKSKRKHRASSVSDSDSETSQEAYRKTYKNSSKQYRKRDKDKSNKTSRRKDRDSSFSSSSEYEKSQRKSQRKYSDGSSGSDKERSESRNRKYRSKSSKRNHKKHKR